MKNKYGFKLDKIKPEDYVFGASLPVEILQPDGNWQDYLPTKEFQNLNGIEPYMCVPMTILNCVETLIKRQYGIDTNWSDRFLATVVDTRNGGSSPHQACEFLRKIGVVTQDEWPFDDSINTTDKFFEKLPPKLYELAREFNEEWDFRHEFVPLEDEAISEALKCSPLLISVYAWRQRNGVYVRPKGMQDNHATTMFMEREGEWRRVFDSYDSPHIKDVDWKATPMAVKRFWIKKRAEVEQKISIIEKLLELLKKLLGIVEEKETKPVVIAPQPQPEPSNREKLLLVATKYIGTDNTPQDLVPDEVACAEHLCTIIRHVDPTFPIIPFTGDLLKELKRNPKYKATLDIKEGNIVINATGTGNNTVRGHTGIFVDGGKIASNNSVTGKWDNHWVLGDWTAYYRVKGGMPTYVFEAI